MDETVLSSIPNASGEIEAAVVKGSQKIDALDRRSKPFRRQTALWLAPNELAEASSS